MGSSGSGGGADCLGQGSIVWVRRRNGSWWPGKILAPDELSTTHLMSPRTGTPVKLLGREDASIDWYNLEKSKRVKAFRCGDFDECIERAESSLGIPAKKREKYARREDAILHALELEKQLIEKEQGDVAGSDFTSCKFSDSFGKKFAPSSEGMQYGNGRLSDAKPGEFSTESDSSQKDEKIISFYVPQNKAETRRGLRVDNSGVKLRMRGLQDFGLKATHPKQKSVRASNGSSSPTDSYSYVDSRAGDTVVGTSHADDKIFVDTKKITNQEWAEEIIRKRDRRHVLPSSPAILSSRLRQSDILAPSPCDSGDQIENIRPAKRKRSPYFSSEFSDCFDYSESVPNQMETCAAKAECGPPDTLMDENPSKYVEDEGSDSSETDDLETESDADANMLSGSSEADYGAHVGSERPKKHKNVGNEELDELTFSGDFSSLRRHDQDAAKAGVSKWQIKGKRNSRYLNKNIGVGSSGFNDGTSMDENKFTSKRRAVEPSSYYNHRIDGFSNGLNESEMIDNDFGNQMTGYYNRGYTSTSKAEPRRPNWKGRHLMDWEDIGWEDHLPLDNEEYLDPVLISRRHMRSPLIEVDLKVQARYKKPPVPIISLMSKLDGKAIIGHPIPIEVLADGFTDTLLPAKDEFHDEAHYKDEEDRTPPPVWRTARRTASNRVARPPPSAVNTEESIDHLHHLGGERQPTLKKPKAWGFIQKKSSINKDLSHISRPPLDRKLSRKAPKKVSSSCQKTRTLSSIGIEQKSRRPKHHSDGFPLDGLIKTDSVPTALACIPVKLVFSRLYEAVGRPPSIASTVNREALTIMDTNKSPL